MSKERLDLDSLTDEQLGNLAVTLVYVMLGERGLRLLMDQAITFYAKEVKE